MQKVVTHNGRFHTDDVFAVATLQLYFGTENIEVIRTRDESIIASGNIVLDVGGEYDPEKQRFDHHQVGAPIRENGVPYSSFGLIWKEYGEKVSGTKDIAEVIEKRWVLPIDAIDNAVSIFNVDEKNISPILIHDVVSLWKPVWGDDEDFDRGFGEICELARNILTKAVKHAEAELKEAAAAKQAYESAPDKTIIVSDIAFSSTLLTEYGDVMFVVFPDKNGNWKAVAVRAEYDSFATKMSFPEGWRGLRDSELVNVSGISDAVFCHKTGYLFVAKSKEGVLEAVKKVLG